MSTGDLGNTGRWAYGIVAAGRQLADLPVIVLGSPITRRRTSCTNCPAISNLNVAFQDDRHLRRAKSLTVVLESPAHGTGNSLKSEALGIAMTELPLLVIDA